MRTATYQFCGLEVDARRREIRSGERMVSITHKPFEVLLLLLDNPGRMISKAEMIESIWSGTYAQDSTLAQCIFVLRKALGALGEHPRFIITVPGKGYQFGFFPIKTHHADSADSVRALVSQGSIERAPTSERLVRSAATVGTRPPPPAPTPIRFGLFYSLIAGQALLLCLGLVSDQSGVLDLWHRQTTVRPPIDRSIAVLPFEMLSSDASMSFFVDGIQEEILTRLTQAGSLRVLARSSTTPSGSSPYNFSEAARNLGVATILEGRVQRSGDRVHVSVELIRASNSEHIWGESYSDTLDDVFAAQAHLGDAVVRDLKAKWTSVVPPTPGIGTDRLTPEGI